MRVLSTPTHDYAIRDVIGKGSQGVVYKAMRLQDNRAVAIKCFPFAAENKVSPAAEKEISMLQMFDHDCIVSVLEAFQCSKGINVVMELLPTDALSQLKNGLESRSWSTSSAFRILYCVMCAVRNLHDSLVCHLDIKLENILVNTNNWAKLCDFGLSEQLKSETDLVCYCKGSVHYTAPEVLRKRPYDGRKADMWSIGVVAFGLFIGRLPFLADDPNTLNKKIMQCDYVLPSNLQAGIRDFLTRLLTKDPTQRMSIHEAMQHRFFVSGCHHLHLDPSLV